jgi:MFS family permease
MSRIAPTGAEDAEAGFPFRQAAPLFALTFVDVLGLTVILPLLHLYGIAFGASPSQIGLIAAAFPLAQLIGVPVMGALSDRYGRKPLLLISQVTTCISFIMLAAAPSLEWVILSRVFDGLFGANLATAQAALTDITDNHNRARGLGLTGAAFGIGFILGPVISLIALEMTDSLAVPALTAAAYSFLSILLTLFAFQETLPPEKRGKTNRRSTDLFTMRRMLRVPGVAILVGILFVEQFIFFGFESLLGLFTLSRLGLLGEGNALLFLLIGFVLVTVQVRYIGPWARRYGERRLVIFALAMLALGLLLAATTPAQTHPFYVRSLAAYDLQHQAVNSTQAILGTLGAVLPPDGRSGFGGVLWFALAVVPLSIGAALIRPNVNSLLTQRVPPTDYGAVLGISAAFASAASAFAPLSFGLIFQAYGPAAPFWVGGVLMAALACAAAALLRGSQRS